MIYVSLGSVVAIKCWWGEHWGIVAADLYGRPTIISNRGPKGGVTEELWSEVVGAADWRTVTEPVTDLPAYLVIDRARSRIGSRYDFWKWNCQDLVYWTLGLPPQSPQRDAVASLLGAAGVIVFLRIAAKGT